MTAMTQVVEASKALSRAAEGGRLEGRLMPAVFGCPYGHTAGIVTAPLPLGRCPRCAAPLAILDAAQVRTAIRPTD